MLPAAEPKFSVFYFMMLWNNLLKIQVAVHISTRLTVNWFNSNVCYCKMSFTAVASSTVSLDWVFEERLN